VYVPRCHEPWPVSGQGPFQCTDTDTQDTDTQDTDTQDELQMQHHWFDSTPKCTFTVQSALTAKHGQMCMMKVAGVHEADCEAIAWQTYAVSSWVS